MFIMNLEFSKWYFQIKSFPTSLSLGLFWNLGFLILILYTMQIISGVFLSFNLDMGLNSCLFSKFFIVSEIKFGYIFSNIHVIIPSFLFLFVYLHVLKNFLFPTYLFILLWGTGVILYMFLMVLVFSGYSLVFGSMGFWAIVVVSNLLSFVLGEKMGVMILFNLEYSISDTILYKIFTYHYLMAIFVFLFIYFHIWGLHQGGSSNSLFSTHLDTFTFTFVLMVKDLLMGLEFLFISMFILFFYPEYYFSTENYLEVNIFVVPEEINAEWYLSMFFMMLKSVDVKFLGVLFMVLVIFFIFMSIFLGGIFENYMFSQGHFVYSFFILYSVINFGFYVYGGSLWVVSGYLSMVSVMLTDLNILETVFMGKSLLVEKW